MNLIRCSKGHFYDMDKFNHCPHCGNTDDIEKKNDRMVPFGSVEKETMDTGKGEDVTIPENKMVSQQIKGQKITGYENRTLSAEENSTFDEKTIGFFQMHNPKIVTNPVVGWLVCVNGEDFGKSFILKSGRNFIGRDSSMDVAIMTDKGVSRQCHAIILYDPKSKMFLVQPGTSKELFYLNEKVVLGVEEITANQVLTIGNTELMFVPCCGEHFTWEEQIEKNKKEK